MNHQPTLVWWVSPSICFETDWIHDMLNGVPIGHEVVQSPPPNPSDLPIHPGSIIVFNHSVPYEELFQQYEDAGARYIAIHLSDETLVDSCKFYDHNACVAVFRNYFHLRHSYHPKATTFGLGYKSGFAKGGDVATSPTQRWYHWCFAGNVHNGDRTKALSVFDSDRPFLLIPSHAGFNSGSLSVEDYRKVMENSKFAICPIGQGNMDTFRLYEALEAGCIPVTLSHTEQQCYHPSYWHGVFRQDVPFIIGGSWEECRAKMQYCMLLPERYNRMMRDCNRFWHQIKRTWRQAFTHAAALLAPDSVIQEVRS